MQLTKQCGLGGLVSASALEELRALLEAMVCNHHQRCILPSSAFPAPSHPRRARALALPPSASTTAPRHSHLAPLFLSQGSTPPSSGSTLNLWAARNGVAVPTSPGSTLIPGDPGRGRCWLWWRWVVVLGR